MSVEFEEDNTLISIITASYNCVSTIKETYASICSQTHRCWEWIVTDDYSQDGTYEYLEKISSEDERVILFRNEENFGAAVSRNNSMKNAAGEYFSFIDSDDIWEKEKLAKQLNFMRCNNYAFSFTSYSLIAENGIPILKTVDSDDLKYVDYKDMLKKKATLGCSTVMIKPSEFNDISMPLIRTGQDYALWLKLLKTNKLAYHLPETLTKYRICSNSISRNKFKKACRQWQIYREIEKINLLHSMFFFGFYAWRAVFRK